MAGRLFGENHPQEVVPVLAQPLESTENPTMLPKNNIKSAKEAGRIMGVGKTLVVAAKAIAKASPEMAEAIKNGDIYQKYHCPYIALFIYYYVTNQTVLTCPCSHETRYSFLCILILYRPYERSVMIPPYPLEFLRLLTYSKASSSELIQLAVPFSLVSSRSPWVCSNSSFLYFIVSCVRGAGTPLLIC